MDSSTTRFDSYNMTSRNEQCETLHSCVTIHSEPNPWWTLIALMQYFWAFPKQCLSVPVEKPNAQQIRTLVFLSVDSFSRGFDVLCISCILRTSFSARTLPRTLYALLGKLLFDLFRLTYVCVTRDFLWESVRRCRVVDQLFTRFRVYTHLKPENEKFRMVGNISRLRLPKRFVANRCLHNCFKVPGSWRMVSVRWWRRSD